MRKLSIFLFFWIAVTLSFQLEQLYAVLFLLPMFLILYLIAEELDQDD